MTIQRWRRVPDIVFTEADGSHILFHMETGQYVALNGTSFRIWEALEEPRQVDEIVAELRKSFDVDAATCLAASERTLRELAELRLISPVGD